MPRPRPELSLVIPIYNEEEVLPQLGDRLAELLSTLAMDCEVVFVDDGSKDDSLALLRTLAAKDPRFKVVSFSRNFGHQRAITAGMDLARGKAIVVMDADLQDPPEVIVEMVAKWREGYDVVYGRRRSRAGESFFKLLTAKIFYRLFAAMIPIEVPLDTGDFRLMSRRVVQTLRGLRETHRFVRGLVAWVGFKQVAVEYDRAARAAGETKYPLRKMLAFAFDGIASFSIMPLRMASYAGLLVGLFGVAVMLFALGSFLFGRTVQGWTTTIMIMSFLFSVQLLLTGIVGEYVGKIYEEVKRRPLYLVKEKINFRPARKVAEPIAPQPIKTIIGGAELPVNAPVTVTAPMPHAPTAPAPPPAPAPAPAPAPPMPAPTVTAPMPATRAPSTEEIDSSNLQTDYGTTPAVMAKLPPPRPKASNPPPAPAPKKKDG